MSKDSLSQQQDEGGATAAPASSYTEAMKPAYPAVHYYAPVATGESGVGEGDGGCGSGGHSRPEVPAGAVTILLVGEGSDAAGFVAGSSLSDPSVRRGFVIRVCAVLMVQLGVTAAIVGAFTFLEPIKYWVHRHALFYYVSYAIFLIVYLLIICCKSLRRRFPCNLVCLAALTLALAYMTGCMAAYHNSQGVLVALTACALICVAVSVFAAQTKVDFTMCSGLILVVSLVFFLTCATCLAAFFAFGVGRLPDCVIGGVVALVFSVFLVYDTQRVVGSRRYQLSPKEYLAGAVQLYLDVVYIFVYMLPNGSR